MFDEFISQLDMSEIQQSFPRTLLSDTASNRKEYFRTYTINHAKLEDATQRVWSQVKNASEQQVINLIGPSGVGKTTLLKKLESLISQTEQQNMLSDPGFIPVVRVIAGAPERGAFDWKANLYWDILKLLNQEFVNYYSRTSRSPSTQLVSDAVQEAIINRGTRFLIIDEAQHIGIGARNDEKRTNHMDVLKSVTNKTTCNIILGGTYKFNKLLNLNEQLSRRSVNVHFARYGLGVPGNVKEFLDILADFQSEMPILDMPNLVDNAQTLYEACLGCIGVLKPILYKALADAIDKNAQTVTIENIYQYVASVKQRKKMFDEILDGESEMDETEEELKQFMESMELDRYADSIHHDNEVTASTVRSSQKTSRNRAKSDQKSNRKHKPGQRGSGRDRVENGEVNYVAK